MDTQTVENFELNFHKAKQPRSAHALKIAALANAALTEGKGSNIKSLATSRAEFFRLNPYLIEIEEGWNSRDFTTPENQEHVLELAHSIAEKGVREPVTVFTKDNRIILTNGECRLRATFYAIEVLGAEVLTIPVKTEEKGSNDADRLVTQIISNSGKPLTVLEKSVVIKRLLGLGWERANISKQTGLSAARVDSLLDLQEAPEAIHQMIRDGKVSATMAGQVVREAATDKAAIALLSDAVEHAEAEGKSKATARDVEAVSKGTPRVNFRKEVEAVFEKVDVDREERVIRFPDDETLNKIIALLKL